MLLLLLLSSLCFSLEEPRWHGIRVLSPPRHHNHTVCIYNQIPIWAMRDLHNNNYIIELVRVSVIKGLGIYFESNFSFEFHHKTILNKPSRMLGFINSRNTRNSKQPSSLKTLYCSLVRSTPFGSIIWSQNLTTYLNDLVNSLI